MNCKQPCFSTPKKRCSFTTLWTSLDAAPQRFSSRGCVWLLHSGSFCRPLKHSVNQPQRNPVIASSYVQKRCRVSGKLNAVKAQLTVLALAFVSGAE
jgi:hypothetical protein